MRTEPSQRLTSADLERLQETGNVVYQRLHRMVLALAAHEEALAHGHRTVAADRADGRSAGHDEHAADADRAVALLTEFDLAMSERYESAAAPASRGAPSRQHVVLLPD